ncbi:hypothetical protein L208DRAFT_1216677, partial [Tricholoma matsutake]
MNTINMSTGFTPFMLKSAHAPRLIPPLLNLEKPACDKPPTSPTAEMAEVHHIINQLAEDLLDAQDSLTAAKISQAYQANKDHSLDPEFNVGDHVLLAT